MLGNTEIVVVVSRIIGIKGLTWKEVWSIFVFKGGDMRVLIACEFSGVVRDEFINKGKTYVLYAERTRKRAREHLWSLKRYGGFYSRNGKMSVNKWGRIS